ncbi:MAG: MNIO family bufferin maturase, partial [Polyangiaceae bacterium]
GNLALSLRVLTATKGHLMGYRERHAIPFLGVGVGLRRPHLAHVLATHPSMDWFEIISENHMVDGGIQIANLDAILTHYRVVPHGVSLSIGGANPLDSQYLDRLGTLVRKVRAPWCSDHLCWTGVASVDAHDLLPMPYTPATLAHVVERVKRVQGELEVPFALENASSYMAYGESTMPEHEFVAEVIERADCGLLLDVNNVFVNAYNHGFDAGAYIDAMPSDRVVQMHLAGHTDKGAYLLDTHSDHVCAGVWDLYARALKRCPLASILIEWDESIPIWDVLANEARMARSLRDRTLGLDVSTLR